MFRISFLVTIPSFLGMYDDAVVLILALGSIQRQPIIAHASHIKSKLRETRFHSSCLMDTGVVRPIRNCVGGGGV